MEFKIRIVIKLTNFYCPDVKSHSDLANLHLRELAISLPEATIHMINNKKNQDWEKLEGKHEPALLTAVTLSIYACPEIVLELERMRTIKPVQGFSGSDFLFRTGATSVGPPLTKNARVLEARLREVVISVALGRWVGCVTRIGLMSVVGTQIQPWSLLQEIHLRI